MSESTVDTSSPSPEPADQLKKNIVWFALGLVTMGALSAIAAVSWFDDRIDSRIMGYLGQASVKSDLKGDPGKTPDTDEIARLVIDNHLAAITDSVASSTEVRSILLEIAQSSDSVGAIPTNMVIASTSACSNIEGKWKFFQPAAGRFLIGSGETTDAAGNNYNVPVGLSGGEHVTQLTIANMPNHLHGLVWGYGTAMATGAYGYGSNISQYGGNTINPHTTTSSGGGQPHNNVPPYYSVYYCIQE